MTVANVLKLEDFRDRRVIRQARARAFVAGDPMRGRLFEHLVEVAEVSGSDRAAVVWIDEYGAGLVHPHLVVDAITDRPRRTFAVDVLNRAWERGIPGTFDDVAAAGSGAGTFAVALGSDGARGWFVVVDSVGRRRPLDEWTRHRLMFLTGECSALVLHRDLDPSVEPASGNAFDGWQILRDLEGFESDPVRSGDVQARFTAGRLIRHFVGEDLVVGEAQRAEQVRAAREALRGAPSRNEEENRRLERALDAYEVGDADALMGAALALGDLAERREHVFGALELYDCAFSLASALGEVEAAIQAARSSGRTLRRQARWEDADQWYGVALGLARSAELHGLAARSLAGLGLVRRERGSFPDAREHFQQALTIAESAGEREALASIHHDLMGLEQLSGDLQAALRHGWQAVNRYESEGGRTRCMAGMAGVLQELGDYEAAEDAHRLVLSSTDEVYYRVYAFDGLAYLRALRGDAEGFDQWAARCDGTGWERGSLAAKAEILCFRGMGHAVLGREAEARDWLGRAVAFAEEHGFTRALFRAEEALQAVDRTPRATPEPSGSAPDEVREGLRAMRVAAAGV